MKVFLSSPCIILVLHLVEDDLLRLQDRENEGHVQSQGMIKQPNIAYMHAHDTMSPGLPIMICLKKAYFCVYCTHALAVVCVHVSKQ